MLTNNKLKPYHGVLVFLLFILAYILISVFIPASWGLYGTAFLQVVVLLFAVVPPIILKTDLKEVFPIKRPSIKQVIGVLIIWVGTLLIGLLVGAISMYLFPEGMMNVSNSIQDLFSSVPVLVAFLIVAIMPAICEEALHRGFILSSLSKIQNKWIVVLIMGVIFGIFHLNIYRFLPTAILGMALSYIMIETKNIILPMLFHFINNTLPAFISFTAKPGVELVEKDLEMMIIGVGGLFLFASVFPFLLLLGSKLIHVKESINEIEGIDIGKKNNNRNITIGVTCSILMIIIGVVIIGFNIDKIVELSI